MAISSISSASSAYVIRQFNQANSVVDRTSRQLAAGSRYLSAADNPAQTPRLAQVQSQISQNQILSGLAGVAKAQLTELTTGANRVASGASATDVRDAIRNLVAVEVGGAPAFSGNAANREVSYVHHDGTSGKLTGAGWTGNVNVGKDALLGPNTATVNMKIDGKDVSFTIASGNYTAPDAVTAIRNGLTSAGYGTGKVTVSAGTDGGIVVTSLTKSTASTVSASGAAATTLKLTGGTTSTGTDPYEEPVYGAPSARMVTFAGREVELANLTKYADQIDAAIAAGDTTAANAAAASARTAATASVTKLAVTTRMIASDESFRGLRNDTLSAEYENIAGLDVAATTYENARATVQAQQAAFALRMLQDNAKDQFEILFGRR